MVRERLSECKLAQANERLAETQQSVIERLQRGSKPAEPAGGLDAWRKRAQERRLARQEPGTAAPQKKKEGLLRDAAPSETFSRVERFR